MAILLAVAAVLAWVGGTPALAVAVVAVTLLNAGFAFIQQMQAERAVEAPAAFLLDLSALTGESVPVSRSAEPAGHSSALPDATDMVFSGTTCTGGP